MAGHIIGLAYEPGRGMCYVEQVAKDLFRLIPTRRPDDRVLRSRSQIRWRKSARQKEKA